MLRGNDYNKSIFDGKDYGMWGCQGGWMTPVWSFQQERGIFLEEDYEYTSGRTGTETKCKHKDLLDANVAQYEHSVSRIVE